MVPVVVVASVVASAVLVAVVVAVAVTTAHGDVGGSDGSGSGSSGNRHAVKIGSPIKLKPRTLVFRRITRYYSLVWAVN